MAYQLRYFYICFAQGRIELKQLSWFGLVWLYGISSTVGYLKPDPIYIYIYIYIYI